MIIPRRKFLIGAATLLAAPAIVRYESLMRVKPLEDILDNRNTIHGSRHLISDLSITTTGGEHILSFWFNGSGAWQYVSQHVNV